MALFLPLGIYKVVFLAELFVAEAVFSFRFNRRRFFALRLAILLILSFVAVYFMPVFWYNATSVSVIFFLVFILSVVCLFFLFDTKPENVIFAGIGAYCTQHCVYQLFNIILVTFGLLTGPVNAYGSELTDYAFLTYAPIYIMTYVATLWCVAVGAFLTCKDWNNIQLRSPQLLAVAGVFLATNVIANAFISRASENMWSKTIIVCTSVTGVALSVLTLWVLFSLIEQKALKTELVDIYRVYRQEQKQLASTETNIDIINRKCHDLKHQIRTIGKTRIIGEQAIAEIENCISIYDSTVKTGNKTLDVILTEKSLLCKDKGINFTSVVDGGKLKFMSDVDIYSLFGNALDNAVEASLKIPEEKRVISITSSLSGNLLLVSVRNFFDGVILTDGETVKTLKTEEKGYHGFGLQSIKATVEKYGGIFRISTDKDMFTLDLLFPVPGSEQKK